MNSNLEKVAEFHRTFDHPIGNLNELEPLNIRQLRIKLILEELCELAEASDCDRTMLDELAIMAFEIMKRRANIPISFEDYLADIKRIHDAHGITDGDNVNKLEELDALADIEYVTMGKVLTAGLHEVFDKNFAIVHENNMTKAHADMDHIDETVAVKDWGPGDYTTVEKDSGFLLFNADGKLTKPHDHKKVQLTLE